MNIIDKIIQVSEYECSVLRRLSYDCLIGHCATVFDMVSIPHVNPIPEEYFDAVIYGVINYFYGGCEPEFDTDEEYNNYINAIEILKKCKYIKGDCKDNAGNWHICPYMNKDIPFLAYFID